MNGPARLTELLERDGIITAPGTHDAITAKLAVEAGFEAFYVSGSGISTALTGLPDVGMVTLTEMAKAVRYINDAAPGIPLIVDGDTGHGSALNAMRYVHELERSGAAAVHIEDQEFPKRCGHLDGKTLVPADEMIGKVRAAIEARSDPNFRIIARCDAKAVEGLGPAIERMKRYVDAGADIIFPEALQSEEEFLTVAEAIDIPLLANMTDFGKTPYISAGQFKAWGFKIVIFPVSALRIANHAVLEFFKALRESGTQKEHLDQMLTRQHLYEIIDYAKYQGYQDEFALSAPPS